MIAVKISSKKDKQQQLKNNLLKLVTLFVFHLEILGKEDKHLKL